MTAILDEREEAGNSHANAERGDTRVLFARVPKASSQSVPPRPAQAPTSPAPTVLTKKVTKKVPSPPLRQAAPPASTPRVTPAREVPAQAVPLPAAAKERREATRAQGSTDLYPPADACSRQLISRHSATAAHRAGPTGPRKKRNKKVSVPTPSSNPSCPHTTRDARQRSSGTVHLFTIGSPGAESGYSAQGHSLTGLRAVSACPRHLIFTDFTTAARASHRGPASQAGLYAL